MRVAVIVVVAVIVISVLVVFKLGGQTVARHSHPPGVVQRRRLRASVSPVCVRQGRRRQRIRCIHGCGMVMDRSIVITSQKCPSLCVSSLLPGCDPGLVPKSRTRASSHPSDKTRCFATRDTPPLTVALAAASSLVRAR